MIERGASARAATNRTGERNRGRFPTSAEKVPPGGDPPRSARPAGHHDLFVTPAQLARANRLADLHWRSPTEDPRTRKCPDCRADGTCPRAAWAGSIIARCVRTYRR
ncbi:hypothetical protein ABIH81_24325 [Micromonospora sp. HUAS YX12]|uniref:Uncharacterized protein n=1 Tax=Micromonospora sp. HUAS YX12 TaxID=3156396 RepID=A0AAU7QX46_9ACTN